MEASSPFLKVVIQARMNVKFIRICLSKPNNECLQSKSTNQLSATVGTRVGSF
jgi:hypothetical protein